MYKVFGACGSGMHNLLHKINASSIEEIKVSLYQLEFAEEGDKWDFDFCCRGIDYFVTFFKKGSNYKKDFLVEEVF